MCQIKQKFRIQNTSNTKANSVGQHHVLLLCRSGKQKTLGFCAELERTRSDCFWLFLIDEAIDEVQCLSQSWRPSTTDVLAGSLCHGNCPVRVWCLAVSLVSAHLISVANSSCDNPKCLKTFPNFPLVANHHSWEGLYLLRQFCVATEHFCFHPAVQDLVTWTVLTVKEAG